MSPEKHNVTIKVPFSFADLQLFQRFVRGIRFENRFALDAKTQTFVDNLVAYGTRYKMVSLAAGTELYRARLNDLGKNQPFPPELMGAPPPEYAGHGRLNPRGIPYLYLASDGATAVSEVRPWIGAAATVAKFKLHEGVNLMNFSKEHWTFVPKDENLQAAETTWRELISWLFSAPFDPRDDTAYIPTQYLAEKVKRAGPGGIIYDSALSPGGYNVALFDPAHATLAGRQVAKVQSMTVDASFRDVPES